MDDLLGRIDRLERKAAAERGLAAAAH